MVIGNSGVYTQDNFGYNPGDINFDIDNAYNDLINNRPSAGGGSGVYRSPLQRLGFSGNMDMGGRVGTQGPDTPPATPPVIDRIRQMYGGLEQSLQQMSAAERQRIAESTGSTVRSLQAIDPLAGYRETAPMLSAPTAAASTYLGAIGANPAQVAAQQALANQMMAGQSASQNAFARAMDDYANNYRRAQEADTYMNQDRALAALGATTQAQSVGLQMARMQQEEAVRKMLLEYQLALATAAIQKGGGINLAGNLQPLQGNILF